jgi:hypothetical protein
MEVVPPYGALTQEWSLYHNALLLINIFGIELCESLRDVCRKIVVFYRDFSL